MKKLLLTLFLITTFGIFAGNAQKIGYCETEKIITLMPEYEKAKAKLEGEIKDVQNQMEEMQVEFNNKYKAYTDNVSLPANDPKKWSPSVQQLKEKELQDLQQRIQDFQTSIQQSLQERQIQLMQPLTNKLDSVINVVMEEKGFTFIIKDLNVIQVNKTKCEDITPLVKQKLKIQ